MVSTHRYCRCGHFLQNFSEEVFGPVVVVHPFDSEEEAIIRDVMALNMVWPLQSGPKFGEGPVWHLRWILAWYGSILGYIET